MRGVRSLLWHIPSPLSQLASRFLVPGGEEGSETSSLHLKQTWRRAPQKQQPQEIQPHVYIVSDFTDSLSYAQVIDRKCGRAHSLILVSACEGPGAQILLAPMMFPDGRGRDQSLRWDKWKGWAPNTRRKGREPAHNVRLDSTYALPDVVHRTCYLLRCREVLLKEISRRTVFMCKAATRVANWVWAM